MDVLQFPYQANGELVCEVKSILARWSKTETVLQVVTPQFRDQIRQMLTSEMVCQITVEVEEHISKELTPNNLQLDLIILHEEGILTDKNLFAFWCYINVPQMEGASYYYEIQGNKKFFLCGEMNDVVLVTDKLPPGFLYESQE